MVRMLVIPPTPETKHAANSFSGNCLAIRYRFLKGNGLVGMIGEEFDDGSPGEDVLENGPLVSTHQLPVAGVALQLIERHRRPEGPRHRSQCKLPLRLLGQEPGTCQ